MSRMQCLYCRQYGHEYRRCPRRDRQESNDSSDTPNVSIPTSSDDPSHAPAPQSDRISSGGGGDYGGGGASGSYDSGSSSDSSSSSSDSGSSSSTD